MLAGIAILLLLQKPADLPNPKQIIESCFRKYDQKGVSRLELQMQTSSPEGVVRMNVKSAVETGADASTLRGRIDMDVEKSLGGRLNRTQVTYVDSGKVASLTIHNEKRWNNGPRRKDRISGLLRAMLAAFSESVEKPVVRRAPSSQGELLEISGPTRFGSAKAVFLASDKRLLKLEINGSQQNAPFAARILMVRQEWGGSLRKDEWQFSPPAGFRKDTTLDVSKLPF